MNASKENDLKMEITVKTWEPLKGISRRYWLEYVVDNRRFIKNGNCIKIHRVIKFCLRNDSEEKKRIDLTFNDIASYQVTNESYSSISMNCIDGEKGLDNRRLWSFYTVENSWLLACIEKETGIPPSIYGFKHLLH